MLELVKMDEKCHRQKLKIKTLPHKVKNINNHKPKVKNKLINRKKQHLDTYNNKLNNIINPHILIIGR